MANQIDRQYKELLEHIIKFGWDKKDRTGTGTRSVFGWQIRHNMKEGFPILTTKRIAWKTMVTELLWFLRGDTNIKFLVDNDCHIWNGDAYKNYTKKLSEKHSQHYTPMNMEQFIDRIKTDNEFAMKWGELGPIYGSQWRSWKQWHVKNYVGGNIQIDQIQNLINELKTNPDSRRLMVNAWNVGELDQMVLPPCHYGFQVYTRELNLDEKIQWVIKHTNVEIDNTLIMEEVHKDTTPKRAISLLWNQRSVDTFLGLPFNISSYGLLLHILANEVNMIPDELIGNLGDVHLYANHYQQALEQFNRTPYGLPILITDVKIDGISSATPDDFILEGYQYHPTIKAPLSN